MSVARYRVWLANLQHLFLELLYFVRTSIDFYSCMDSETIVRGYSVDLW